MPTNKKQDTKSSSSPKSGQQSGKDAPHATKKESASASKQSGQHSDKK